MNHQHILGLEWCPLSPTTPLMTTRYIDGAIEVETVKSAYGLMPLLAHQRNAIEWRFVGGPIVAPFYMLTVSLWFTYSTFVRLLPCVSSHMNHQHILGFEWCPSLPYYILNDHQVYRWYYQCRNGSVSIQSRATFGPPAKRH